MIEWFGPPTDSCLSRIGDEAKHVRNPPLLVGIRHRLQCRRGERDDEIVSAPVNSCAIAFAVARSPSALKRLNFREPPSTNPASFKPSSTPATPSSIVGCDAICISATFITLTSGG